MGTGISGYLFASAMHLGFARVHRVRSGFRCQLPHHAFGEPTRWHPVLSPRSRPQVAVAWTAAGPSVHARNARASSSRKLAESPFV